MRSPRTVQCSMNGLALFAEELLVAAQKIADPSNSWLGERGPQRVQQDVDAIGDAEVSDLQGVGLFKGLPAKLVIQQQALLVKGPVRRHQELPNPNFLDPPPVGLPVVLRPEEGRRAE